MADVYVKTEALSAWKSDMEKINKSCLENIENIMSSMGELNSSFQGDYAEKFETTFDGIEKLRKYSEFIESLSFLKNACDEKITPILNDKNELAFLHSDEYMTIYTLYKISYK